MPNSSLADNTTSMREHEKFDDYKVEYIREPNSDRNFTVHVTGKMHGVNVDTVHKIKALSTYRDIGQPIDAKKHLESIYGERQLWDRVKELLNF